MPKKNARVGLCSLKQSPDESWQVRWWDSEEKRYVRRKLPATSYAEAVTMAKLFNQELAGDKGFLPAMRGTKGIHKINDAVDEAIRNSGASPATQKEYARRINKFLGWLADFRPGVTTWDQVDARTLGDYLHWCEAQGLAWDTIRQRWHSVRATSLYMNKVYPARYTHVAGAVKFRKSKGAKSAPHALLDAGELDALLDYAKEIRPDLAPVLMLMGCAGLRELEAVSIRRQDVDWKRGTVSVTTTSIHAPKNKNSHRVIPIPAKVLQALREADAGAKIIHPEGFLFMTASGKPWSLYGISPALKRVITSGGSATKIEALASFFPRLLRKTFINLSRQARCDARILKAYVGHSAGDVLGENYEQIGVDLMRSEIVDRMEVWKSEESAKAGSKNGIGLTLNLHRVESAC